MIELKDPYYNKLLKCNQLNFNYSRCYPRLQHLPAISVCKHPTKEITEHTQLTYKEEPVSLLVIWRPEQQLLGLISVTIELSLFVTNFVKVNLQVCWHWFFYLSWLLRRVKSFRGRCIGFLIRHQIISGTRWFRMKPIGFVMATYLHSRPNRCQYKKHFEPFELII